MVDITVVEVYFADDVSNFGLFSAARYEDVFNHDLGGDEVYVAVWGFYFVETVV